MGSSPFQITFEAIKGFGLEAGLSTMVSWKFMMKFHVTKRKKNCETFCRQCFIRNLAKMKHIIMRFRWNWNKKLPGIW